MLTHLQIRDFAIIDAVELELGSGLTALTGETGAGKSILVDAVMAVIGGRAGPDVIRHGAERAELSATFALGGDGPAPRWLAEQSIEHDAEVILRRVIGRDGRSRAYVNGQTLPLGVVRELGELLIDIHGQSEFLSLLRRDSQRALLDGFAGNEELLAPLAAVVAEWREASHELKRLTTEAGDREARLELLRYQVHELTELNLADGEVESISAEATRLAHAGRLMESARAALDLLYEGADADAHGLASRAQAALRPALGYDPRLAAPAAQLDEALIALKEAGRSLAQYLDGLDVDPRRQEQVERRLATIEELARKHRVSATELPAELARLGAELAALERAGTSAGELGARVAALVERYRGLARKLSRARVRAAASLSEAVTTRMRGLGMPGGRFEVRVETDPESEPAAEGADAVEFLVSANPGQPVKPVARVASGGELSRISLSVQVASVSARRGGPACMIFDEVDAGVGGAVAEMVGRELHALGHGGQVLCVTHLPQVAGQADQQVRVTKLTDGRTSRTALAVLSERDRVEELARMLGGIEVTDSARRHARELLKARRERGA
jgi:DNA repair protein RecN (Recombination protein N)